MWDVDKEENFVLNLDNQPGYDRNEYINCIAHCHKKSERLLFCTLDPCVAL